MPVAASSPARTGLSRIADVVLTPAHLRRTGLVALLVGSWLVAVNLGDTLLHGEWTAHLWLRVGLNYFTPFVVANLGLLSRHPDPR